jgi:hypothetical protein
MNAIPILLSFLLGFASGCLGCEILRLLQSLFGGHS